MFLKYLLSHSLMIIKGISVSFRQNRIFKYLRRLHAGTFSSDTDPKTTSLPEYTCKELPLHFCLCLLVIWLYVYLASQKPVLMTHRNICWGTTALKAHCSLCRDYFTFVMILISEKVCHEKEKNPDIHLKNKCTKNEQLRLFVCDLNFIRVHSVFLRGRLWLREWSRRVTY